MAKRSMTISQLRKFCEKLDITLTDFDNKWAHQFLKTIGWEAAEDRPKGLAVGAKHGVFAMFEKSMCTSEKLFVIFHEIGHILMGHVTCRAMTIEEKELEANIFASVFMAMETYKAFSKGGELDG